LMRTVSVVLLHEPIHSRLRRLHRLEPLMTIEQLTTQRQVESLDLPGRGGGRRLGEPVGDRVLPQILSNNTSPPLPNRSVNCLPMSS
jgi:hypothetical protein